MGDDCMEAGGRATNGAVVEEKKLLSVAYNHEAHEGNEG